MEKKGVCKAFSLNCHQDSQASRSAVAAESASNADVRTRNLRDWITLGALAVHGLTAKWVSGLQRD